MQRGLCGCGAGVLHYFSNYCFLTHPIIAKITVLLCEKCSKTKLFKAFTASGAEHGLCEALLIQRKTARGETQNTCERLCVFFLRSPVKRTHTYTVWSAALGHVTRLLRLGCRHMLKYELCRIGRSVNQQQQQQQWRFTNPRIHRQRQEGTSCAAEQRHFEISTVTENAN